MRARQVGGAGAEQAREEVTVCVGDGVAEEDSPGGGRHGCDGFS